jgi:hypothetical protein
MRRLRSLNLSDVNRTLLRRQGVYVLGVLDAANLANELYASSSSHPFAIGDCILAKLNLLHPKMKPRRNINRRQEKI